MATEPVATPPAAPVKVGRSQRAEQLLDVALELIAERGYEETSVQAIADAAGITKPIIYRIYPSRHALLLALFRREQKRTDAVLDGLIPTDPGDRSPAELMADSLTGILDAAAEHPHTWRLVLFPLEGTPAPLRALVKRRRERLIRRAAKLVEWGVGHLDTDQQIDADILARMLVTWAEEHARIMLSDDSVEPERLVASARALLASVAWRA